MRGNYLNSCIYVNQYVWERNNRWWWRWSYFDFPEWIDNKIAFWVLLTFLFLNRHSRPLFSLFPCFQYTVDSKQIFNVNKFLPMTGFEPRTSGVGSDRSTNWATQPLPSIINFTSFKKPLFWHVISSLMKY